MPVCKKCGARISKFDSDICPVCGEKNPLEGVSSETIEITSHIDINPSEFKDVKVRKKIPLLLLSIFVGWSGAPFFYLKEIGLGFIWLAANIFFLNAIGVGIGFTPLGFLFSYLIGIGVLYFLNISLGLVLFFKKPLKDKNGELVK